VWQDEQWELPSSHHVLGAVRGVEADQHLHPLVVGCRPWSRRDCRHRSAQGHDGMSRHNVPGAGIHHVEGLVMLISARVRVKVVIDHLQHLLGVLVLHLLILIVLWIHYLLALLLPRRSVVLVRLLLLFLTHLHRKLFYLPAIFDVVAPRAMHRALWTTLVTAGGLLWPLVTVRPSVRTRRCSCSGGNNIAF
jgi:hypothetical protein